MRLVPGVSALDCLVTVAAPGGWQLPSDRSIQLQQMELSVSSNKLEIPRASGVHGGGVFVSVTETCIGYSDVMQTSDFTVIKLSCHRASFRICHSIVTPSVRRPVEPITTDHFSSFRDWNSPRRLDATMRMENQRRVTRQCLASRRRHGSLSWRMTCRIVFLDLPRRSNCCEAKSQLLVTSACGEVRRRATFWISKWTWRSQQTTNWSAVYFSSLSFGYKLSACWIATFCCSAINPTVALLTLYPIMFSIENVMFRRICLAKSRAVEG